MVVYALTDKCNLNCMFCSNEDFFIYYDPPAYNPHTLSELKEYFKKKVLLSEDNITLTGGEPTLRKDLFEILNFLTKRYKKATIMLLSNGRTFYYDSYCKRFKKYDKIEIEISLNSYVEHIHDELTKCKGSFKQTHKGIKNLLSNQIKTAVRVIITKKNYMKIQNFAEFIKDEYPTINRVVFIYPRIVGKAKENKDKLIVKYKDTLPYLQKTFDFLIDNNIEIQLLHFPFCVINKKYWQYTLQNPYKNIMPQCRECSQKEDCPGVSNSYIELMGNGEFNPIKD